MTVRIPVTTPSPYDVVVGREIDDELVALLEGATAVAVVADPAVAERARHIATVLGDTGIRVTACELPGGERAKTLGSLESLWDAFGAAQLTRSDAIVSVGGGATTDVTGFAAATWLRGVRVVHVPTTLLAMVDAAVGGKTGINTHAGKNLVGAFHEPVGVLVDLDVLDSLPTEEWANGMAEVVKAGLIDDTTILSLIEDDLSGAATGKTDHVQELIERSIAMKARVVSADFRESGLREALNYGHTLGHAIERAENYSVPHGHAVAVGMVFAAALAHAAGFLDGSGVDRHRDLLEALNLPTRYNGAAWPSLLDSMRLDKKSRGGVLRFVVLDGQIGRTRILSGPAVSLLKAAYAEVAA